MSTPPRIEAEPTPAAGDRTHVPLGDGRWLLWPHVALRSAGFPAAGVLRLRAPDLAGLADELTEYAPDTADTDAFRAAFARAAAQVGHALREIASSPRLRTAVTWQNHRAIETAIEPLLRHRVGVDPRNSQHRQHEELVAGYWQRYCTKNDSIGHFGPVGWVRLTPHRGTSFEPRPDLVASRDVFFETWAIDALARIAGSAEGASEWLAPRRIPYVGLDGQAVLMPQRRPLAVTPATAYLLRRCDGTRPARQLAADLVGAGLAAEPEDVYAMLRDMVKRRWIVWALELPVGPHPEDHLRQRLNLVDDESVRVPALEQLTRLERARDRVADGWFDGDRLLPALRELDLTFAEITKEEPSRNKGKMYGGRTLVYHDSRRDLRLEFGADLVGAMAPLELILDSAAWFTFTVGQALNAKIGELFRAASARLGRPTDLASLWFECMTLVHGAGADLIAAAVDELQRRWSAILRLPPSGSRVAYRLEDLRDPVRQAFPAPHSGWLAARYVSPDCMLVAPDVDAIRRGDFDVVLAEIHLAIAAYRHSCFVSQHPRPAELLDCVDRDSPRPRLLPVLPKDNSARLTVRTHPALIRDRDYLVALFHHTVDPRRPRVVMSADLVVEEAGGRLGVRLPTGELFDVLDCFSELLLDLVIDSFDMFGRTDHLPRITVDRLVVQRECWWFDAAAVPFARLRDEPHRFWMARRWLRTAGLPTQLFVTSPLETKPFFVDFDSPTYVNIFAKAVRRVQAAEGSGRIKLSEMLPSFDQLWLTDTTGARYTSELRMVAVDSRPVATSLTHP